MPGKQKEEERRSVEEDRVDEVDARASMDESVPENVDARVDESVDERERG